MPRQLRVEYPGAIYHVMSRGDRQKDIYLDDVDRQDFMKGSCFTGLVENLLLHMPHGFITRLNTPA
jgi:hypothetical protein